MIRILSGIVVTLSAYPAISLVAKGTVVLALGLIGAWFARRSRAAVRHAVLASAFSVLLALPIVSVLATPVPIAVPVATGDSNIWPLFDYVSVPSSGAPATGRFSAAAAKSGLALPPVSTMLLWGWFLGTAFFMIPIVRGLLQIRSLRRFGLPWRHAQGARRRVEVLLHKSLPGPMTCGVLNPVIILPADAQCWDKQDLERALVHELEHVRRYDWAIHCLARVACAAYWFHPLVWIAWRQLALEAERSCDDAVLRSSEATAYADQLVGLARRRSVVGRSPALAMANRSDLAARIGALLDGSQRRGPVGALVVAAACIAAAAIVLTMSPLRMVAAPQPPATPPAQDIPKWDAVSIKRCTSAPVAPVEGQGAGASASPDRVTLSCLTVANLIQQAYVAFAGGHRNLSAYPVNTERLPAWADSERYTIEARAQASPGSQEMLHGPMLQALLEDRFALKIHPETRPGLAYALIVGKAGLKLPPFEEGSCTPVSLLKPLNVPISAIPNPCKPAWQTKGPNVTLDEPGFDMDSFAALIGRFAGLDGPVINNTGASGRFNFHLQFVSTAKPGPGSAPATDDPPFASIFTAVEQLGLKLEATKGPHQFLVVDHVERPTEN